MKVTELRQRIKVMLMDPENSVISEGFTDEEADWLLEHQDELSDEELGEVIGEEAVPIFRQLARYI